MFLRCLIHADRRLELIPSEIMDLTDLTYNITIKMTGENCKENSIQQKYIIKTFFLQNEVNIHSHYIFDKYLPPV